MHCYLGGLHELVKGPAQLNQYSMNTSYLRAGKILAALIGALVGASIVSSPARAAKPAAGGSVVYSGRAVALKIDGVVSPQPGQIVVCDTGPLAPTGGALSVSQSNFNLYSGALTIDHVNAQANGAGPQSSAESSLVNFHVEFVNDDGHRAVIEADYIHGEVSATVDRNGKVSTDSKVTIQNLRVNGRPIVVTGKPNQVVQLDDLETRLIINEQASSGTKDSGDISLCVIRVDFCHCIDGFVGLLNAGITASGKPSAPEDCGKITGGGWIAGTPSGAKGTFGMSGGVRRGEYWGHLNYIDHGTGMKVESTAVTGFQMDPASANGRIISYAVKINGEAGTARLRVVDNGEPGRNDIFDLTLSTGYRAAGDLGGSRPGGGNIQLHKCPPGWE